MKEIVFWLKQIVNVLKAHNEPAPVLQVTDITALTAAQLDALNPGDIVIKITGNERHLYTVNYKNPVKGEILLTYADWQNVEGVYYEKSDGVWGYVQTDNTHIAESE